MNELANICPACEAIDCLAITQGGWVCIECGASGWVDSRRVESEEEA